MNTGQIIKSKSTERFTTLPNELIKSDILSLEEKGLLSYLLSLPSDWVLYRKNLYKQLPDSKGTIDRVFKSLQDKGYILSAKQIGTDGKFIGWNHIVYDIPFDRDADLPNSDNPTSANADFGQSAPILNTNYIQKTDYIQNTDDYITELKTYSLSELFKESLMIRFPILRNKGLEEVINIFNQNLIASNKSHTKQSEYQKHFNNWLNTSQGTNAIKSIETKLNIKKPVAKPDGWSNWTPAQKDKWLNDNIYNNGTRK
jgi:hypothetical protein